MSKVFSNESNTEKESGSIDLSETEKVCEEVRETETPEDVFAAASALGQLRDSFNETKSDNNQSQTPHFTRQDASSKPTILDKVISHPIISNSINYVLEKTINSANTNILIENKTQTQTSNLQVDNESQLSIASTSSIASSNKSSCVLNCLKKPRYSSPLCNNGQFTLKRKNENEEQDSSFKKTRVEICNQPGRFKRPQSNLRQAVAISSAISTQKSIQNIRDLSALNINIESRKKLTMLIQFLKLGNNQLSEKIENLIDTVDKKRQNYEDISERKDNKAIKSDVSIEAIRNDIVTTVKKIVNVVSKVSADALNEPAREKVREALLKLPTNWSTLVNSDLHLLTGDDFSDEDNDKEHTVTITKYSRKDDIDNSNSRDSDSDESNYEDSVESQPDENIPTIKVTNQQLFQKVKRQSVTQRILASVLKYKEKKKGTHFSSQMKSWFRRRIKSQLMHESSAKALVLAQESLDMINNIIKSCNDSLDKANDWNLDRQKVHQVELSQKLQDINPHSNTDKSLETIIVKDKVNQNFEDKKIK